MRRLGSLECPNSDDGFGRSIEPDSAREHIGCLDIKGHLCADEFIEIACRDGIKVNLGDFLPED